MSTSHKVWHIGFNSTETNARSKLHVHPTLAVDNKWRIHRLSSVLPPFDSGNMPVSAREIGTLIVVVLKAVRVLVKSFAASSNQCAEKSAEQKTHRKASSLLSAHTQ